MTKDRNPVLSQNVVAKYSGFTIPYVGYFWTMQSQKMEQHCC